MKRPAWATVVGVLGIIFSCTGILGAGYEIMMPGMMKMQKEVFGAMQKDMTRKPPAQKADSVPSESEEPSAAGGQTAPAPGPPMEMFKVMEKMWDTPEWFGTWMVVGGTLKLLLCALYLFASIFLLQTKRFAIPMFYCAAGSSIALGVVKGVLAVLILPFIGMMVMFGGMFGVAIDVVLVAVVATGNKDAFLPQSTETPPMTGPPPLPS